MTQLNKQSMVLDILQSNQLIENEMDLCGPWSVGALRVSGPPNQGVKGTAEDVDVFADNMAAKLGYTPANFPGVSVQDMYTIMTAALDPKSNQRNIHWWDITPDVTHIKAALNAGYPVLITANEQNIIEKRTGQRAYPWNLNANHVLPIAGIDKDGDFICPDQLNNNFQGYWPPIYLSSRINPSWATVVQVVGPDTTNPWLKTIPSNDPTKWPAGFNAQNFMAGVQSMNSIFWSLLVVGLDYNSGLAHAWQNDMTAGNWRGAPVKAEFQLPWKGSNVPCLVCQGGFYTWENGIAYWHPFV